MSRTTYTVDARDLFTVHKAGCQHLIRAIAESATFNVAAEPNRASIIAAIADEGSFIEDGAGVEFGPCLRHLPKGVTG